jgi:two-component system response regulator AtoC
VARLTLPRPEGPVTTRVLVVDDEAAVRFALEEALAGDDRAVTSAASAAEACPGRGAGRRWLTDLVMPGEDGLALAARLRELDSDLPVILLTARGSERIAVQAMKAGVHDYLTKPFGVEELRLVVARAAETRRLRRASRELALERLVGQSIVGESPAWRALMEQVRRAGRRDVTVLVRGETGTGKELIAAALHAESARRDGPAHPLQLRRPARRAGRGRAVRPHRGAFTGATADRRGFFSQADGGTLVLDEVGRAARGDPGRPSCAPCRAARSSAWAAGSSGSTSGSSPAPTATCAPRSPRAASARTSTTAWR